MMSGSSSVSPASDNTELVELMRRVLQLSDGPRSVAQIVRDMPKSLRVRPEVAESLLVEEVTAGRLYEYPKIRNKAQFWFRSPLEFARSLILSKLQGAPVTRTDALKVIKGKAFEGLPKQVREQLFDDLLREGALYQHPPFIGTGRAPKPKFGSRSPAPSDYLRDAIRKVAEVLGLSERDALEAAVLCAHQELRLLEPEVQTDLELQPELELQQNSQSGLPSASEPDLSPMLETRPVPGPPETTTETVPDSQELLMSAMRQVNPRVESGDMVDIIALRSSLASDLPGAAFDAALLKAAAQRTLAVHRYDRPGLLQPAERDQLLQDEQGQFYNTVSLWRN
jgi:hypothetical protein